MIISHTTRIDQSSFWSRVLQAGYDISHQKEYTCLIPSRKQMSLDVIQKETTWDYSVSSVSELHAQEAESRK